MKLFLSKFKWIMLLSGLLTCTTLVGLFSPHALLTSNFGETLSDSSVTNIIVRNWSALIGLIGVMLIYGAYVPPVRNFTLVIAAISKITFIVLVLLLGREYFSFGVGTAVIVDAIMLMLYAVYLIHCICQ